MFNLKTISTHKKLINVLSDVRNKIIKISSSPDLFDNIQKQLHRDFLESECGRIDDDTDSQFEPLRKGVIKITEHEVHPVEDEELDSMKGGLLDQIEEILTSLGFDPMLINGTPNLVGSAINDLDESVDHLRDVATEGCPLCGDDPCSCNNEESEVCPDCNQCCCECNDDNHDACPDCGAEYCQCGEEQESQEFSIMPNKMIINPTTIMGNDWLQVKADVELANKMSKESQFTQDHILTIIDPTKYSIEDEALENELIDTYTDIIASTNMPEISNRLQKLSYTLVQNETDLKDGQLSQDDRIKLDGPVPYNYQRWFENVGESHHEAMSRLDEHKNPNNELMKLRIKDGERSNPMREELATTETRMRKEDMNNSKFSVNNNIETMIDDLERKLAGRHSTDEDKNIEALLDTDSNEDVWNQTFESRIEKKRSEKEAEPIEQAMEDLRPDEDLEVAIDAILEDKRTTKTAGIGGGIKGNNSNLGFQYRPQGQFPVEDAQAQVVEEPKKKEDKFKSLNDMPLEARLDPNNYKKNNQYELYDQLRKEEDVVSESPTAHMQNDNSTIAMGSGDASLLTHAAGGPMWNDMTNEMNSKNDFKKDKNAFPYKPKNLLI